MGVADTVRARLPEQSVLKSLADEELNGLFGFAIPRKLARGEVLGIYPEGTRSPDGRLYRGRTGIARMVLEAKVPVIPVAMIDTEKVQPIGQRMPKIRRIGIIVGEPLDFSRFDGMEGDRIVLRAVTDEIMYELKQLSGQEYVDAYASSVKEKRARLAR